MLGGYRIGSLFGVPIHIKFSFLLLLVVAMLVHRSAEVVFLLLLTFVMVLLHELGHVVMAQRLNIPILSIDVHFFGGAARMAAPPRTPRDEILVAAAGPAASFCLAVVSLLLFLAIRTDLLFYLMAVNLALGGFNLLPALPMDGGRILRAALTRRMGHLPATRLTVHIARGLAGLIAVWGLFGLAPLSGINPFVVALAVVLWWMAGAELRAATFQHVMRQCGVEDFAFGAATAPPPPPPRPPAHHRRPRESQTAVDVLDAEGHELTGPHHLPEFEPDPEPETLHQPVDWPFAGPAGLPYVAQARGPLVVEEQIIGRRRRWVIRDARGKVLFSSDDPF